jgi:hypothetical protein
MGDLSNLLGGQKFVASDVDLSNIIPAGTYKAIITKTEVKTSKASGKQYASIEFTMLTPAVNGRKFWLNLHLQNDNETARSIAKKDLAKLCAACGIGEADSLGVFMNRKVQIKLSVSKRDDGELQNRMAAVLPWSAVMQAAEPSPQAPPSMPSVPDDDDEAPYWDAGRE